MEGNLPQSSVHSSCSSWDNLGDEDPWIIRNVGIVYSSSNAKAQARVPLQTGYDWHFQEGTKKQQHILYMYTLRWTQRGLKVSTTWLLSVLVEERVIDADRCRDFSRHF